MKKIISCIVVMFFLLASCVNNNQINDKIPMLGPIPIPACIVKKDSVISYDELYLHLFIALALLDDKKMIKSMKEHGRIITTKSDIKVEIIKIVPDGEDEELDVVFVNLVDYKYVKFWVIRYNINCDGEENDKTKRRNPKGQGDTRRNA